MAEVSRVHMQNELAMFSGGDCAPYSDLSIAVGPEEDRVVFAVHKYKLITHSDVFRAMLEHNMEESKTNMIIIEEFSPTAVKIMLIFLYTGSVCPQELELEDAFDVMQLAEKYNIPALKTMCEQDLISRVCAANVIDCMVLADFHQASHLYEHCIDFMNANRCDTLNTESWSALKDRNPRLSSSIMERMIRSDHTTMGRMDVEKLRYLEREDFRVLIAVEMGMKNHEVVPLPLISAIAGIHRGAVARILSTLCKHSLVAFERSKKFDGYRLTVLGYDFLALKALCTRGVVGSIGVGKESDVYVGGDPERNEYAFLKALADRGFPVPRPVDVCRHLVVMGLIEGRTLCHVDHVEDVGTLYD
ncbi:BTB/POZ domain protein, partial [Ostertagia ostertagi]